MSWYVNATDLPMENFDESFLSDLREQAVAQNAECGDAFDAAARAAVAIVRSGAIGSPPMTVNVTMNGHANPDHHPREGWARDLVTVTVEQSAPGSL